MARKLKVFRTAIGFHDAYVAAPSRKAALDAWGTDKDLFARGAAAEVTDPALMAEPLEAPGSVFRRLRDAPAEELSPGRKQRGSAVGGKKRAPAKAEAMPPPPRPDPAEVNEARKALARLQERHRAEQSELSAREKQLADERRETERRQAGELRSLEETVNAAEKDYEARLARWRRLVEAKKT